MPNIAFILHFGYKRVTQGHRKDKDKGRVLQRPKDIKYNIRMSLIFSFFFIFVYFSAYSESTLEDLTISPCRLYEGHLLRQKS